MNGKQVKKIKRKVYGEHSFRARGYYLAPSNHHAPDRQDMVVCDRLRNLYQRTKKLFKSMNEPQKRKVANG